MLINELVSFLESNFDCIKKSITQNEKIESLILNTKTREIFKSEKIGFIALKGKEDPLEKYLDEILKIKPLLIIADVECNYQNIPKNINFIVIKDLKENLDKVLKYFYSIKMEDFNIFGVTGTNGKTTITTLLHKVFFQLNDLIFKSTLIGTIKYIIGNKIILESSTSTIPLTTPDICTIYYLLNLSKKENVKNIFMEVSSHSLDQDRIKGIEFKITSFTNLSRDHLDYHKTMKNYFEAKKKLFTQYKSTFKIINKINKYGKILYNEIKDAITFSLRVKEQKPETTSFLLSFTDPITNKKVKEIIETDLLGRYNLENLATVFITSYLLIHYLLTVENKKEIMEKIKNILRHSSTLLEDTGRLEKIHNHPFVFIDYAHTPDALKNSLKTLSEFGKRLVNSRLILVFGAGGNRDQSKRKLMGKVASKIADIIIITSDNPRNEDPLTICQQIQQGIDKNRKEVMIELDRKEAIKKAISIAKKNDIILIAGKGHEKYQIIGNKIIPFSDKEFSLEILKQVTIEPTIT